MPEISVEGAGDVPVDEALVLDDIADEARLRDAHERGTPVVVRAGDADAVRLALARPEVSSVLVPADRPDLLALDLRRMTYG